MEKSARLKEPVRACVRVCECVNVNVNVNVIVCVCVCFAEGVTYLGVGIGRLGSATRMRDWN